MTAIHVQQPYCVCIDIVNSKYYSAFVQIYSNLGEIIHRSEGETWARTGLGSLGYLCWTIANISSYFTFSFTGKEVHTGNEVKKKGSLERFIILNPKSKGFNFLD